MLGDGRSHTHTRALAWLTVFNGVSLECTPSSARNRDEGPLAAAESQSRESQKADSVVQEPDAGITPSSPPPLCPQL
eukprot:6286841-Alexandrium_andersonii.AAC.1